MNKVHKLREDPSQMVSKCAFCTDILTVSVVMFVSVCVCEWVKWNDSVWYVHVHSIQSVTDIAVFTAERTLFVTVNAELPIVHVQKSKQNSRIIFIMNSFKIAFISIWEMKLCINIWQKRL